MGGSTSDIINNLPRNVLEGILVCLTIQDAVRTNVLSRNWRYIWTTLPKLVFDDNFCRGSVIRATSDKLMMTIYKVLLLHHGPILKFTLTLANLESCPEINQLTFLVSNNGIREFTLHVRKGEPYRLPSTLFSCLRLEYLNLSSCVFKPPPSFKGFTMLLSPELYEVVIAGDVLSSLASSCPLLERLTFSSSNSFDYLEIVAPNLKYFSCQGLFKSICVRIPHVEDVTVVMKAYRNQLGFNEGEISNPVMLLCNIPVVEFLVLNYHYVKCMAESGTIPFFFFVLSKPQAFHSAAAAIDLVVELFDLQDWSDSSLNKLVFMVMKEVSGTKAEMEFIKLLLAESPMLQSIKIKLKSMEVAEELRIVKKLMGYQRASVHAVITFPK
ncbi:hypothetical protein RHSIM_RhsimUnG0011600 [Rhododendron simsii]|uniref:F-box/LRR-repeat protein 15/At3g58940/PEG3-like LRR domain-containing protein n=1 Tax=Rhododendron simsii TaxID=118357 RepID=A0A834FXV3_RHOSS|nr:hypothetical protein RHSIM_RhsimUnG0011600 [Rhododendron simsii]